MSWNLVSFIREDKWRSFVIQRLVLGRWSVFPSDCPCQNIRVSVESTISCTDVSSLVGIWIFEKPYASKRDVAGFPPSTTGSKKKKNNRHKGRYVVIIKKYQNTSTSKHLNTFAFNAQFLHNITNNNNDNNTVWVEALPIALRASYHCKGRRDESHCLTFPRRQPRQSRCWKWNLPESPGHRETI